MRIDPDTARSWFAQAPVARLATASQQSRPHLVPVTFAVHANTIITAIDHKPKSTTALKRLRNIAENPHVALLADHYDDEWSNLWWVRADGDAVINDPTSGANAEAQRLRNSLIAKYRQYRERAPEGPLIVITVRRWSGWAASE